MTAEHEGCPDCPHWQQRIAELCRERDEAVARYEDFRAAYTSEREEIALDEAVAAESAARELWAALNRVASWGLCPPATAMAREIQDEYIGDSATVRDALARHRAAYGKAGT